VLKQKKEQPLHQRCGRWIWELDFVEAEQSVLFGERFREAAEESHGVRLVPLCSVVTPAPVMQRFKALVQERLEVCSAFTALRATTSRGANDGLVEEKIHQHRFSRSDAPVDV
jgi:hypothetical protein